MVIKQGLIFLLLAFFCFVAAAAAQDPSLRLEVNPKQGTIDDVFVLSLTVEGLGDGGVPTLVGGDDFRLSLIGSQVEMVGTLHEQRFRSTFRYQLLPKREGVLKTPSAELALGGKRMRVDGLSVAIEKAPEAAQARAEDVFLLQSIDSTELFVGQQTVVAHEIYSQRDLVRPQFTDLTFDDFVTQPLPQEDPFERSIEGKRYQVLRSRRAVYPLRDGLITLPSVTAKTSVFVEKVVRYPALGGIFSLKTIERVPEERVLHSNALTVRVKPLPPQPKAFSGWGQAATVVGITDLHGGVNTSSVATGETVTLTVRLSSTGNIQGIKEVPLPSTDRLRVYQERSSTQVREHLNQVITTKTFVLSLVPLVPGRHTLPEIALDYFDPQTARYARTSIGTLIIAASGNALVTQAPNKSSSSEGAGAATDQRFASSDGEGDSVSAHGLRHEGYLDMLQGVVSFGTALMAICAVCLLFAFARVMLAPRKQVATWTGTSEEVQQAFFEELKRLVGVSGETSFEGLRAAVRRSVPDPAVSFEFCALLDQLEAARGRPAEGVVKHLEKLVPLLRLQRPYADSSG